MNLRAHPVAIRIAASLCVLLLAILIVLRVYLSSWVLNYVNATLSHIPGYQGSVQSINIDLYRGAYRINKLVLNKVDGNIPTPFVSIEVADFSVQWRALLHGRVVSSVTLLQPVINFAVNKSAKQTGENVDWTQPIKALSPVDINYVRFREGSITYQDFSSTPPVNIYIHKMHGEVSNLRNVEDPTNPLPSTLNIQGSSIGGGALSINGRMNILKQTPDMKIKFSLENVNLPALNSYTEAYGAFSFKSGSFNLYSIINVIDDKISGYVKPVVTNLSVDILKKANPLEVAWSALVSGVLTVFTNPSKDQFATQVDLEGSLGHVGTNTWSALGGVFHNAFINAMSKGFNQAGDKDITNPQEKPNE